MRRIWLRKLLERPASHASGGPAGSVTDGAGISELR